MKQVDVIVGKSYLFYTTTVEHKKDMIGTIVTVIKKKERKTKPIFVNGFLVPAHKRLYNYKLSNGRNANSSELKELKDENN